MQLPSSLPPLRHHPRWPWVEGLGGSRGEWHLLRTRFLDLVLQHHERGGNVGSLLDEILSAVSLQSLVTCVPRQEASLLPGFWLPKVGNSGSVQRQRPLCGQCSSQAFLADAGEVVWAMGRTRKRRIWALCEDCSYLGYIWRTSLERLRDKNGTAWGKGHVLLVIGARSVKVEYIWASHFIHTAMCFYLI